MIGWEKGLDKRQVASTYCSGDMVAKEILIFEKLKFALSKITKMD